jgi:hypothetical protein
MKSNNITLKNPHHKQIDKPYKTQKKANKDIQEHDKHILTILVQYLPSARDLLLKVTKRPVTTLYLTFTRRDSQRPIITIAVALLVTVTMRPVLVVVLVMLHQRPSS